MKLIALFISVFSILFLFYSCSSPSDENVVEVTASNYRFEMPDTIPSGWTTFKLINNDPVEHFIYLSLIPDSIPVDAYHEKIHMPFQIVLDSINAGKSKAELGPMFVKLFPSWYFTSVKAMGGTGIISPGKTAVTTIKLSAGKYIAECYTKMNGVFHSTMGMYQPLYVTEDSTDALPPEANANITLTNDNIAIAGEIESGSNTIAVHFKEHPKVGLGNDIHLIRVDASTNMNSVAEWMDWMNVKGLEPPAPANFLGGVQEMPVGYTSYFKVDLEPGNYALITEAPSSRIMFKKFTIE